MPEMRKVASCEVAVIWIDWYAYHVARFKGLNSTPSLSGRVVGLELVSGIGVHRGLRFREELPEGLAIETLRPGMSWSETGKVSLAIALWRRLNALQPKVVLVPGYYTLPGLASAVWASAHGACSVLMTETTAFDHKRSPLRELMKKTVLRLLFDWAITGGRAHVGYLEALGFPKNRIAGCYDVVDNDLIQAGTGAARAHVSESVQPGPYFLFVGRLAKEKNVATLLRSWISYREQGGTWPLILAGDGQERAALEAIAKATPFASAVQFTGLKSLRELIPIYAAAGCFVLPSTCEPWGLVVNEAMAAGLPVLVSRRCGCREDLVIEGDNGFSFDPTDVAALTRHMRDVERLTPEERARMGQRSSEIISAYTPHGFGRSVALILRNTHRSGELQLVSEAVR